MRDYFLVSWQSICYLTSFCTHMPFSHLVLYISRYQIPDDWPYQEARILFKEPAVFSDEEHPEIKWSAPDEEVITVIY